MQDNPRISQGNIFTRLGKYFRIMFPIHKNGPTALLVFFSFYLNLALWRGEAAAFINADVLVGVVSVLLLMILMRVFDELKDEHIDPLVFPDRPLVTGEIRYADVRILGLVVMMALLLLNLNRDLITSGFLFIFVFMILSWQWWLFEKQVSGNLSLTFITHQPIAAFQFAYVYCVYVVANNTQFLWQEIIPLCIIFWLPFFSWEFGRKIRAPEREDAYLTYTRRFGTRAAPSIVLVSFLTGGCGVAWIAQLAGYPLWFSIYYLLVGIACAASVARFVIQPVHKNNQVKETAEAFMLLYYVMPILAWAFGMQAA